MKHLTLSDLGLLPIKLRRVQLAARYYWYTRTFSKHLAFDAMEDSKRLAKETTEKKTPAKLRGWYFNFQRAIRACDIILDPDSRTFPFDFHAELLTQESKRITELISSTSDLVSLRDALYGPASNHISE